VELKPSEIKKRVIGGHNVKYGPAGLFVGEYAGEMWATNKYWITRAERVAPLLVQYNLSAAESGGYEVNGTVRRATGTEKGIPAQAPDFSVFLSDVKGYQPGVRARVAGRDAYTLADNGALLAVYLLPHGEHVGLAADTLAWLSDTMTAPLPKLDDGTYLSYGDVSVLFRPVAGVAAVIRAEVIRTIERAHYADEGRGPLVPAVTEPREPRVLGLMMGTSYGA
jgi:hypothetical protein